MPKIRMFKALKIGFVLDDSLDKTDGVQQYILTLGSWLQKQGHLVHYLVGETHRTDVANVHSLSHNVSVRFNGNNLSIPLPANRRLIKKILAEQQFDVLHVQAPYNPWLAKRIIQLADKKTAIVGTFHILPFSWIERVANRFLVMWLGSSLERFDSILAVSAPASRFATGYFRQPIEVLPCVIEPNAADIKKTAKQSPLQILFLGRLVKRKGCLQLLRALKILADQNALTDVTVTVAGKGPDLKRLKRYVHQHSLDSFVQFVGYVSEASKYKLLADADIAIFPSLGGESFGIVLIEAMAASNGVILAGNNPGYSSVMEGHIDQMFNPRDTAAVAKKLQYYINNESVRNSAREWQQQHVQSFDVAVVGPKILKKYKAALLKKTSVR